MQRKVSTVRKLLCQHGIDVNGRSPKAQSPAIIALERQNYEILKILLRDPRLNINNQDDRGYTALHLAVIYDDPVAMRIILDHKHIDVNYLDSAGRSALLLATMTYDGLDPKRNQIIYLLLLNRKTLVHQRDLRGRSVLWHGANTGNKRMILQLAQISDLEPGNPDDNGVSPLGQARKRGNIEMYAFLQSLTARVGYRGASEYDMESFDNEKCQVK
jgi:ankyrin repeat protein